jgi:superfamily I DNA/RNA helicase
MILNPEQQIAANALDGVWVVIAGPGSGKTTVMIQRYLNLLSRGIPTSDILNLSFTSAAASEMVKRVGLLDAEKVFRTFHSFALEILKKERAHLPFQLCETVIPVATEDYRLLFDLIRQFPAINNFRTLKKKIETWKCQNVEPNQAIEETRNLGKEYFYALAFAEYEKRCREEGWLDFDDCIREVVKLFETNPEVLARWKRRYVSVDECQDTDVVQFRLLQLIFEKNIFVVGDENQLIYEWRSAQSGNLTNFASKFPGAQMLYLGRNYRSTQRLVGFLKEILPVDNGLASHMVTENEEGVHPRITEYGDDVEEAHGVLAQVTDPVNTAILARTNRQLFVYQKICTLEGIKYKILGKKDFWEQNEVRKLLRLAKDSNDPRSADVVLADLIRDHDLIRLYRNTGDPMESDPVENLNSIMKLAVGKGDIHEFLNRLRKMTHARRNVKGLTLSTVHQFKGREQNHVFLIGCNQGKMPHKEGELGEERRIFFVACSRAAHKLDISYYGQRSVFLTDHEHLIEELEDGEKPGSAEIST